MTDEQIIKALECCASSYDGDACDGCPFNDNTCDEDSNALSKYSLDLIKHQNAEIERLTNLCTSKDVIINSQEEQIKTVKADAYKEFAERLKYRIFTVFGTRHYEVELTTDGFDRIVKELTEGSNGE